MRCTLGHESLYTFLNFCILLCHGVTVLRIGFGMCIRQGALFHALSSEILKVRVEEFVIRTVGLLKGTLMTLRRIRQMAFPMAVLGLMVSGIPALACMWIYGTNLDGKRVEVDGHIRDLSLVNPEKRIAEWSPKLEMYQKRMKANPSVENRSDYAAALIHVGDVKLGIRILEEIERTNPGLYVTAANLGTAFELSGENENALEWISEGLRRNANSHYGSEWVHVKILEAKIALAKDPAWLKTHSILNLDFGNAPRPELPEITVVDSKGKARTHSEVKHAIAYQLHERLGFIPAPDPIVADLLFDLANLYALTTTVEVAQPVYDLALKFGVKSPELVNARKDYIAGALKLRDDQAAAAKIAQEKINADRLAAYTATTTASVTSGNSPRPQSEQPNRTVAIVTLVACTILASVGIVILTLRQNQRASARRRAAQNERKGIASRT
jgi:hypothetical protein